MPQYLIFGGVILMVIAMFLQPVALGPDAPEGVDLTSEWGEVEGNATAGILLKLKLLIAPDEFLGFSSWTVLSLIKLVDENSIDRPMNISIVLGLGDQKDDLDVTDAGNARVFILVGAALALMGGVIGLVESMAKVAKYGSTAVILGGILAILGWNQVRSFLSDLDFMDQGDVYKIGIGAWIAFVGGILTVVGGGLVAKEDFSSEIPEK